jgi:hypothetical protein
MNDPFWMRPAPRVACFVAILGVYLTAHGYHSREGDQAYRLPLLLAYRDPAMYANDPFVSSFSTFNPHRGYLGLVDIVSRPLGLSMGLFALYALTFGLTAWGVDRLARAVWPEAGSGVGLVAVVLVLLAQAGNLGTNHLFEPMLLDRLLALSLGWTAMALVVTTPTRGKWLAPPLLGTAAMIHPSFGLQLTALLTAAWIAWSIASVMSKKTRVDIQPIDGRSRATRASGVTHVTLLAAFLLLCLAPALSVIASQSGRLFSGLSSEEFRLLEVYVQSPQHMVPHLWRKSQWLAGLCFPTLALLGILSGGRPLTAARLRLLILFCVNLLGLAVALVLVEGLQNLRVTVFQPFRMATVVRGISLVFVANRVLLLARASQAVSRARALVLVVALIGDWTLVIATVSELAATLFDALKPKLANASWAVSLAIGCVYLARHDTESGQWRLLGAVLGVVLWQAVAQRRQRTAGISAIRMHQASNANPPAGGAFWNRRRALIFTSVAWLAPMTAAALQIQQTRGPTPLGSVGSALVAHCRFSEIATDDQERLAAWCRTHTPRSARFIGPPGPKGFRYWSRRAVAFNRAASPYHAVGLADWARRFRDHVAFDGTTEQFARAYLQNRQRLEHRYDELTEAELAALARRQGATHVLAAAPKSPHPTDETSPLELLRVEGRFAVYQLRQPDSDRHPETLTASAGTG